MRTEMFYICEGCGKRSHKRDEIFACEASHYGLTPVEFDRWAHLKAQVQKQSYCVSITKNAETEAALDRAIEKLLEFETEHGLEEGRRKK